MSTETTASNWLRALIAPVVVAVVVGMGASYLTAREALARFDERLNTVEVQLERVEKQAATDREASRNLSDRLIRLETKIDILISRPANP